MNFDTNPRRVVVTGIGVINACGTDVETFWNNIQSGVSGAKPVTRFDVTHQSSKIAAEIQGFDSASYLGPKKARRFDLSMQYGVCAAIQAARDAEVDFRAMDPDRAGVVEACSLSGVERIINDFPEFLRKGSRRVSPLYLVNSYCGAGSGEVALELGCQGHALTYSSGSASGNDVMGYAMKMIQDDEVDVMMAGGTEAPILLPLWCGFCAADLLTRRNEEPQASMRPFDAGRDGFLLGEGAAFVVLEELSHALQRNAFIYAELAGHGRSCEAYHSVAEHPEGLGPYRAMQKAMHRARLLPSEIEYVNAHGTATEGNDKIETLAIKKFFGPHANRLAISSTKPLTGHLLAAAGALETVICVLSLHHQIIPPTINQYEPMEGCDLDYVPNEARSYPLKTAMNLNVGFGGKNSCLILKRCPEAAPA